MQSIEFSVIFKNNHCQLRLDDLNVFLETPEKTLKFLSTSLLGCSKSSESSFHLLTYTKPTFQTFLLESPQTDVLIDLLQHFSFPDLPSFKLRKSLLVFLNPHSGRGLSMRKWRQVREMFGGCSLKIIETRYRGHASEITKGLGLSEYDGIVCVSGDGLVHEVVNGLCSGNGKINKTPVGVIPAGSGNALAQYLNDGENVQAEYCAFLCIKGNTQDLDVSEISFEDGKKVFSFLSFSWGYIADVDIESDFFRCCGILRYDVYGAWRLLALRRYFGEFKCEGVQYEGIFTYFWICNLPFVGEGMFVAPEACGNDGFSDFMIMKNPSRFRLAKVLLSQDNGRHLGMQGLECFKGRKWSLSPRDGIFSIDGDFYPAGKIQVEVLPSHVRIFR
jgi:sphingosine kinase